MIKKISLLYNSLRLLGKICEWMKSEATMSTSSGLKLFLLQEDVGAAAGHQWQRYPRIPLHPKQGHFSILFHFVLLIATYDSILRLYFATSIVLLIMIIITITKNILYGKLIKSGSLHNKYSPIFMQ